jgi:hypothetical protein
LRCASTRKLQRAGVGVASGAHRGDGCFAHPRPQIGVEQRRGRLLDDLLMAALHRALALKKMDGVAVVVAKDLELDVVGMLDQLLQVDAVVAKRVDRLAPRRLQRVGQLAGLGHDAHPLAAAARRRLDEHRIADRFSRCAQVGVGLAGLVAGDDGHARRLHRRTRRRLRPHHAHRVPARADEGQPGRSHGVGEIGVLGEKAVAGVDGVAAARQRNFQDTVAAQVGVARGWWADEGRFIGQRHVQGAGVGVGVDGDGGDPHLLAGADNANGDLPAIGDQDFAKHRRLRKNFRYLHKSHATARSSRRKSFSTSRRRGFA